MEIYNAKEYWSKHLEGNVTHSGVGFTVFGKSYNEYMYKIKE